MEVLPANSEAAKPPTPRPPTHVAIIMDGNGRWAKSRGLPRIAGHKRGAEAVRRTVRAAAELGIGYLTLYGFSSENWKRPPTEVDDLMGLLRLYLASEIEELDRNGVRLRVIGQRDRLQPEIVQLICEAEGRTAGNAGLNLTVALSYGGRAEIAEAARCLAFAVKAGELQPEAIDETLFERHLLTAGIPDPDLLIRTGGDLRLSNFLLYQCAYTELWSTTVPWPQFDARAFNDALASYAQRQRRFGK